MQIRSMLQKAQSQTLSEYLGMLVGCTVQLSKQPSELRHVWQLLKGIMQMPHSICPVILGCVVRAGPEHRLVIEWVKFPRVEGAPCSSGTCFLHRAGPMQKHEAGLQISKFSALGKDCPSILMTDIMIRCMASRPVTAQT